MHEAVRRVLESGVVTGRTGSHPLHSSIDAAEAECLARVIAADPAIARTLEVGCAYGVSALVICTATAGRAGAHHTLVDPYQSGEWDGAGVRGLEAAGVTAFTLLEEPSAQALPRLAAGQSGRFDLVFVDGWHTFDQVMLDAFYATRLLRTGGYLAFDDVTLPSVRRVVDYCAACPFFTQVDAVRVPGGPSWKAALLRALVPDHVTARLLAPARRRRLARGYDESLVVLRKTAEDTRGWDWDAEV